MSHKLSAIVALALLAVLGQWEGAQGGVLRLGDSAAALDATLDANAQLKKALPEEPATTPASFMADDSTEQPAAEQEEAAHSRDADASVSIAPSSSVELLDLAAPAPTAMTKTSLEGGSAKLLLLSTPRLSEKPREPEENIEEPEEIDAMDATTTESSDYDHETTTTTEANDSEVSSDEDEERSSTMSSTASTVASTSASTVASTSASTVATVSTKLYPINDTLYASAAATKPQSEHDAEPRNQELEALIATPLANVEPQQDNVGVAPLIGAEPDYVLLDSELDAEAEQFATFTHADSDLHLQPIVQSVEIVPSSVDDALIVNYVHSW